MTPAEAVSAATALGVTLGINDLGQIVANPGGRPGPEVKAVIKLHKERLKAAIRLRAVHRSWGLSEDDLAMIERALLEGRVGTINVVVLPPGSPVA